MQKTVVLYVVAICLSLFGAMNDAHAYTYDATGAWSFTADDGQVILGQQVPVFGIDADVLQNGNSFSIQTHDIYYEGENYGSFGADGSVYDATYSFSPSIALTADLAEMPGMQVKITLSSFELQTETTLNGAFDVFFGSDLAGWTDISDLSFSGVKSPVPLPAAFWILGAGLMGIAGVRRKYKK